MRVRREWKQLYGEERLLGRLLLLRLTEWIVTSESSLLNSQLVRLVETCPNGDTQIANIPESVHTVFSASGQQGCEARMLSVVFGRLRTEGWLSGLGLRGRRAWLLLRDDRNGKER